MNQPMRATSKEAIPQIAEERLLHQLPLSASTSISLLQRHQIRNQVGRDDVDDGSSVIYRTPHRRHTTSPTSPSVTRRPDARRHRNATVSPFPPHQRRCRRRFSTGSISSDFAIVFDHRYRDAVCLYDDAGFASVVHPAPKAGLENPVARILGPAKKKNNSKKTKQNKTNKPT